jgi:hypothetical protein
VLKEQQVMFEEAQSADQAKALAGDQPRAVGVAKTEAGAKEMAGDKEIESNKKCVSCDFFS